MEEDQNSVREEVTPQDHESNIVDEQSQNFSGNETFGQENEVQEKNWRELRRKAEEAERRQQEYEQKLQMQEEFIKNLLSQKQVQVSQEKPEEDEFSSIPKDEYLYNEQVQKLIEKKAKSIARDEFLALERERETQRFHERLRTKYSDFDDVVNSETIKMFENKEPELAKTIADLKDPYKMGLQTYNFIKSMNLIGSYDERKHAKEVSKQLEKNEKTVQSPQVFNKRPMAQAFSTANMGKEEKKRLYEEMMGYASHSPGY